MSGQLGDLVVSLSADIARFRDDMGKATNTTQDAAQQMTKHMTGATDQIQGMFSGMGKVIGGAMAILGGGAMFKDMVSTTKEVAGEITKLKVSLGISAEEASILRVALDDVFLNADDMAGASSRITKQLVKNEEAFQNLGVATRDSNGGFRSTIEIMSETNTKLLEFKEGTDRNVEGMKVYGKGWEEARKTLKLTAEGMTEAKTRAEELHLIFGDSGLKAVKEYKLAMKDIDDVFESVKVQIGTALIPELTKLAVSFGESSVKGIPSFISGLHSVEAEIMRMAMLADKAGGSLTAMGYYASGGKFTDTGKWWKEQNDMYKARYEQTEKDMQTLANLEVGLDKDGNKIKPKTDKAAPNKKSTGAVDENAASELANYIGEWNKLQDKINEMNPYMTDYQREVQKVNDEYGTLIGKYPQFTTELEHNRGVMLAQVKVVKEHKDAIQEMSDVYQLELQDQAAAYEEMSQIYQMELQDQEKATQAISDAYQEVLMEQEELYKSSPWEGMKSGIRDYADEAKNLGDQFKDMTVNTMQQMEQALTNFVMTGKLNFKDLANSIIQDLIRIQMRQAVSGIFSYLTSAVGSAMGSPSEISYTPSQIEMANLPARAAGGPVSGGQSYLVGERGPEIFTPNSSGGITPNNALGGNVNLKVEIINATGQPQKAKDGGTKFDGAGMVKTIILEAMDTDPGFRWAMRGAQ
jgi:hypothetical protein